MPRRQDVTAPVSGAGDVGKEPAATVGGPVIGATKRTKNGD
jgi:hypothetical protein